MGKIAHAIPVMQSGDVIAPEDFTLPVTIIGHGVSSVTSSKASKPKQIRIGTEAIRVLKAVTRERLKLKNTGPTQMKIGFGWEPTQIDYHECLQACLSKDDGTSPTYTDTVWQGEVWAISSATGGTMVVEENT